jgi:hypothetical protein
MKRKFVLSTGAVLGAVLFMILHGSSFAVEAGGQAVLLSHGDSSQATVHGNSQAGSPPVQISIDKASLDNHGTIELRGTAPAGKPVYVEVWTDKKVRASRFDSDPDKVTGIRPYILYMTEQMPAFYRILTPTEKLSVFDSLKGQGGAWSYSLALKDAGAECAFAAPAAGAIRRYKASFLGSVVGSRGELLAAMSDQENANRAMQLVKARFRSVGVLFVPNIEMKPDGTFSARITVPEGAPSGKYNIRAVVDRDTASRVVSFENRIGLPYVYLSNAGTTINLFYPLFLSLLISIFGVLMGAGGGFILNPLLVSLWPLPHTIVAGTVMPTVAFSQGSGIVNYSRIKFINWKLGISIGLVMLVGAFIGPKLTELVTVEQYKFVFGWILIVLAGLMLWQTTPGYLAKNSREQAILKEYRKKAEAAASKRA